MLSVDGLPMLVGEWRGIHACGIKPPFKFRCLRTAARPLRSVGWELTSVSNISDTGPSGSCGIERLNFLLAIECSPTRLSMVREANVGYRYGRTNGDSCANDRNLAKRSLIRN